MGNVKNGDTVKPAYNGPVYSGHPVCYGDRTTSPNFQLPYIFLQSYLYIAVTLYITVTLPFPKVTVVYRFDCNLPLAFRYRRRRRKGSAGKKNNTKGAREGEKAKERVL